MAKPRISCSFVLNSVPVARYYFRKHPWPCYSPPQYWRPYSSIESFPRLAQPSFWQSMVPKFLRTSHAYPAPTKPQRSNDWNPATFFIIIFLFIGSNSIQMIALKNDYKNFSRKADTKIGLLKDAIERVHRGEDVDVERLLGSGDEEQEAEWEDVLKEIENEDRLWRSRTKRRDQKQEQDSDAMERDTTKDHKTDSEVSPNKFKAEPENFARPTSGTRSRVSGNATRSFY